MLKLWTVSEEVEGAPGVERAGIEEEEKGLAWKEEEEDVGSRGREEVEMEEGETESEEEEVVEAGRDGEEEEVIPCLIFMCFSRVDFRGEVYRHTPQPYIFCPT